jgi:hypothetical protein
VGGVFSFVIIVVAIITVHPMKLVVGRGGFRDPISQNNLAHHARSWGYKVVRRERIESATLDLKAHM